MHGRGKAFQVMIDNNLDFEVALYPYELVTYGETGSVCHDWMQYLLIKRYLEEMTQDQTLVMESGHPWASSVLNRKLRVSLFPTVSWLANMITSMIGKSPEEMGVANYGQMTAGGWMYIGPQGIVHGTFNTILNAGRMKLGIQKMGDLGGKLFVTKRLGRYEWRSGQGGYHC